MKRSGFTNKGIAAILLALFVFGCVVTAAPFFLSESDKDEVGSGDDGNGVSQTAESESLVYYDTTSFYDLYYYDGYKINGGDIYCDHNWQDWIMTKPASLTSLGSELRYCNSCLANQKREFGDLHGTGEMAVLDVECLYQMPNYPNGCEVVALATVLKYLGYDVSVDFLIDNCLPRGYFSSNGDNPFYHYLGDPRELGVGCYAPCIVTTADNYFDSIGEFRAVTDVSGRGFDAYKSYISSGVPVIFWGTTYMDCDPEIFGTIYIDGEEIIWRNHSHCFVMIGYTETTYIFCDPLRGVIEYPKEDVEISHGLVYSQACIIQ